MYMLKTARNLLNNKGKDNNLNSQISDFAAIIYLLRKKLFIIAAVFFFSFIICFQLAGNIIFSIRNQLLPQGAKLVYVTPLEIMVLKMKIALVVSIFAILPIILYIVFKVLMQKQNVKINSSSRFWIVIAVLMIFTFIAGTFYAYYYMLPIFIEYLFTDAAEAGVTATYSIFSFVSFVVQTSLIFGFVFETPLILYLLTKFEVVKYKTLVGYRKHIYIIALVLSSVITPSTDLFSMIMVAIPLLILFEISMLIIKITMFGKNISN